MLYARCEKHVSGAAHRATATGSRSAAAGRLRLSASRLGLRHRGLCVGVSTRLCGVRARVFWYVGTLML